MVGTPDQYEATLNAIAAQATILDAAIAGEPENQEHISSKAELLADEVTLRNHWKLASQVVESTEPARCAACGEPRDCSTARTLFGKYLS